MTKSQPCVLIYNPISGHGHLDSWNALFVGFLLVRGFRVLALTPDRMALETRLSQRRLASHPLLHVLDWNSTLPRPRLRLRIRRIWQWWLVYGHNYASKRPETRVTPGMPAHTRAKKRVFQILVPPLFYLSRALRSVFRQLRGARRFSDGLQDSSELHFLEPMEMALRINAALRKSSWRPDCMFNMYLDMYKTGVKSWQEFAAVCNLPWGGIRFVPSDTPPREGYYALPSLRGMCFLDESACQAYSATISDKHFQYLPDITNTELPEGSCALAEEILRRAAGRKIVFLGGSIGGQKNIARWCELIALADPERWFFAQVGEIHANTFSLEDTFAFERLVAAPPENLLLHTGYLSDEREFNAVIKAADVLFSVYRDFRISSNMPGKAAHFDKPILVSDGFLVGERVRKFGIGLAVPEDDAHSMLGALERLVAEPVQREKFLLYRTHFSEQATGDSLENFLNTVSVRQI
jgi:glycosyltransferase involved in cell wall biosynthesis